jgi:hypothetical protein
VYRLVHSDKIPAPAKAGSGDYLWTDADVQRARQALTMDRRKLEHHRTSTPQV